MFMNKIKLFVILFILFTSMVLPQMYLKNQPFANTFSIVARDPATGEIGAAVQSHWFNVGAVVIWGEAGVGVIATQSFVNASFGLHGLTLLKSGLTPKQVVDSLIGSDDGRDLRQLAVLDAKGNSAAYTGKNCVAEAGHLNSENYSVQANLMLSTKVWPAMEKAFKESKGPLAERLIAVLEAAQKEGGDIRGKQSAAILVYKGTSSGKPWDDKLIDLRVDDNPAPIPELKRLLKVQRAYDHMNNGDLAVEKGDMQKAMFEYSSAEKMFPGNEEMKFWHAVTLINKNKKAEGYTILREVFKLNKNYRILIPRIIKAGLLNVNAEEEKRISKF
jgi:uncharacterized Ntn-hydrolase superfamily protein